MSIYKLTHTLPFTPLCLQISGYGGVAIPGPSSKLESKLKGYVNIGNSPPKIVSRNTRGPLYFKPIRVKYDKKRARLQLLKGKFAGNQVLYFKRPSLVFRELKLPAITLLFIYLSTYLFILFLHGWNSQVKHLNSEICSKDWSLCYWQYVWLSERSWREVFLTLNSLAKIFQVHCLQSTSNFTIPWYYRSFFVESLCFSADQAFTFSTVGGAFLRQREDLRRVGRNLPIVIARPLTDLPLTQIAYSVLLSRRLENARAEDLLMRAFLPAVPFGIFLPYKTSH